ncbi:MAG: cobalt-precorrin-6X reductase [Acidimicrobiales bacterium]|nr:cobalt-precorrin-6X reductase [Acidimicrobiales bacterium]
MTSVLVLAGTTEATELAEALRHRDGIAVTSSFAGRTRTQRPVPGAVRVGGFGGVDGLAAALVDGRYDLVVDATHPFAARMPHHVAVAADRVGVPRLRLVRPPWTAVTGDRWHHAADLDAAARMVAALGARRVLLTTGRLTLAPFARLTGVHLVTRSIEPPDPLALPDATVIVARGPFTVEGERALLEQHRIDALVTKNSGGPATAPKLGAARERGTPVVVVDRPPSPSGPSVATVAEALAWIDQHRRPA